MKYLTALSLVLLASTSSLAQQPSQGDRNQALARAGLTFLDRTDLKGSEAEAMAQVRAFLAGIVNGQLSVTINQPPAPSEKSK